MVIALVLSALLVGGTLLVKVSDTDEVVATDRAAWYSDVLSDESPTEAAVFDSPGACSIGHQGSAVIDGGVRIASGMDAPSVVAGAPPGTTFVFESGTHDLSGALEARDGDRFVGEPGAVIDGGLKGDAGAIKGGGRDVEVAHLTFRNFGTPDGLGSVNSAAVNRSVADGWWVHHNLFANNDGAALFLGADSLTEANCFESNGQYGVSLPSRTTAAGEVAITDVVVRENEFSGNNQNDLERTGACSGCTGAMKFWSPERLTVVGNHVHDNNGPGIWIDHNGLDVLIEGNLVENNQKAGIVVETSYNTRIWSNVVLDNALDVGESRPESDPFPDAGIFISGSGGAEGIGSFGSLIDVAGNRVDGNHNGVTLFEDSDRFCSAVANQSVGRCTLTGGTIDECVALAGQAESVEAFEEACRWRTRRVAIHHNHFAPPEGRGMGGDCGSRCSRNSAFSTVGNPVAEVRSTSGGTSSVTLAPRSDGGDQPSSPSLNSFFENSYEGIWSFGAPRVTDRLDASEWKGLGQDPGSTGLG